MIKLLKSKKHFITYFLLVCAMILIAQVLSIDQVKAATVVSSVVTDISGKKYLEVDGKPFLYNAVQTAYPINPGHSGSYGCTVGSRSDYWACPAQDIKSVLTSNGQGDYTLSAWVKFSGGSGNVIITIGLQDDYGVNYYYLPAVSGSSSSWTQITGTIKLRWTTTLKSAVYYIQTNNRTGNIYFDDCSLKFGTTELLTNPGLESGNLSSWSTSSTTTATVNGTYAHSGSYGCSVATTTTNWGSVLQDVKSVLVANGQGNYNLSAWAKFSNVTDTARIVICTNDSGGNHFFRTTASNVSTSWTQLSGTLNVTWTGTLNSATFYIESVSSADALYVDDFSLKFGASSELLLNPGFEDGTSINWLPSDVSTTINGTYARSGSYGFKETNSENHWGCLNQDIKSTLLANGQGTYNASSWLKLVQGTDNINLVIRTNDDTGYHYFANTASISTSWTQISSAFNITWTGTLNSATYYIDTSRWTGDICVDDSSLKYGSSSELLSNPGFETGTFSSWYITSSSLPIGYNTSQNDYSYDMQKAVELNYKIFGCWLRWRQIEATEGNYDWTELNKVIDYANTYDLRLDINWGGVEFCGVLNDYFAPDWILNDHSLHAHNTDGSCVAPVYDEPYNRHVPDFNNTTLLQKEKNILTAVLNHLNSYDTNHRIVFIQLENEVTPDHNNVTNYINSLAGMIKSSNYQIATRTNFYLPYNPTYFEAANNLDAYGSDPYTTRVQWARNLIIDSDVTKMRYIAEGIGSDNVTSLLATEFAAGGFNSNFNLIPHGTMPGVFKDRLWGYAQKTYDVQNFNSAISKMSRLISKSPASVMVSLNTDLDFPATGGHYKILSGHEVGLVDNGGNPPVGLVVSSNGEYYYAADGAGYFTIDTSPSVAQSGYFDTSDNWVSTGNKTPTLSGGRYQISYSAGECIKLVVSAGTATTFAAPYEVMDNPGFETGTTDGWFAGWSQFSPNCSIAAAGGAIAHSGSYGCKVYDRTVATAPLLKDISNSLKQGGQGTYYLSGWAKLLSGSDTVNFVITCKGEGDAQSSTVSGSASSSWTNFAGTVNLTWTGKLQWANIAIYTNGTIEFYVDDVSMKKIDLLANPGFESGSLSGWSTYACSAAVDGASAYSGSYGVHVSSRANNYATVYNDITQLLLQNGQGNYNVGAWARLASGSDNFRVQVAIGDDLGTHYYYITVAGSTNWTQISGILNLKWIGTLTSASFWVYTTTSTSDIYLDDCSLQRVSNLLVNPEFENGSLSGWNTSACSAAVDGASVHSGLYGTHVSSRANNYATVYNDITQVMLQNGQGNYNVGAWARLASGSDNFVVQVTIGDDNGTHYSYFTAGGSTNWTQMSGILNLTWTGTLTSASFWVYTSTSNVDIYLDDCSLQKAELLMNQDFETGNSTSWYTYTSTATVNGGSAHGGSYGCSVSNRTSNYSAIYTDITKTLLLNGQGNYNVGAWSKLASGSDNYVIAVNVSDNNGTSSYFIKANGSTSWSQIKGILNLTWTGPLQYANLWVYTTTSTSDIYVDDCSLIKVIPTPVQAPNLYEAEGLTVNAISSGDTHASTADSNMSGGYGDKFTDNAANDYIEYTVNVTVAGTYNVKVKVNKNTDRGIFQLAIDGINQGSTQDTYSDSSAYAEFDLGNVTFTSTGNKLFRFTITGKYASSSGYKLFTDYIKLTNMNTSVNETENQFVNAISSGDTHASIADSNMSGGYGDKFTNDATNDYIEYAVYVTQEGTYDVRLNVNKNTDRGIFQLSINGVNQGATQDTYSASSAYEEIDLGNVTFLSKGLQLFRFTISGKNASSTGYKLFTDCIRLVSMPTMQNEIENLFVSAISSAGDTHSVNNNNDAINLSGGLGDTFVDNAINDYIEYATNVPEAGTYNVKVKVNKNTDRGIFQLSIDGINQGATQDNYSASSAYAEIDLGNVTFTSTGDKLFRFTITGKNASSTGYKLLTDFIKLIKQ